MNSSDVLRLETYPIIWMGSRNFWSEWGTDGNAETTIFIHNAIIGRIDL